MKRKKHDIDAANAAGNIFFLGVGIFCFVMILLMVFDIFPK